ncbi:hypothetical protein Tco_0045460 [Tanacetum coccineum]
MPHSRRTASDILEEGGMKLSPLGLLWAGPHTCYNGNYNGKQGCKAERIQKDCLYSDCSLQLRKMMLESLVIADQHATVNLYPGLVYTACHTLGIGAAWLSSTHVVRCLVKSYNERNPHFVLLRHAPKEKVFAAKVSRGVEYESLSKVLVKSLKIERTFLAWLVKSRFWPYLAGDDDVELMAEKDWAFRRAAWWTASDILEEGGDDVKSAWPLWAGPHTCYNGNYNGKQGCKAERIQKDCLYSDCSLQLRKMMLESLVIADQHATVNIAIKAFGGLIGAYHGGVFDSGEVVTRVNIACHKSEARFGTLLREGRLASRAFRDEAFWRSQVNFGLPNPTTDEMALWYGVKGSVRRPSQAHHDQQATPTRPGKATRLGVRGSIVPNRVRISRSGGRPPESKGELLRLCSRDMIQYLNRLKESESLKLPTSIGSKISIPIGASPRARIESYGICLDEKCFLSIFHPCPLPSGSILVYEIFFT